MRCAPVFLCAMLLACSVSAAPEEPSVSKPDLEGRVAALMTVLHQYELIPEIDRASEEVLRTIVAQADPGGGLYSVEDAEQLMAHERGRIFDAGIRVSSSNEQIVVVEVMAGSGAEAAGVRPGDIIETLDKGPVSGMRPGDMAELLRGTENIPLLLGFRDVDGGVRETNVSLMADTAPAVDLAEDLPCGLAYVRLNGIYEKSDREILSTLRRWVSTDTSGLVLDLRGAGGANADAVAGVASLFTGEGAMLFAFRDKQDQDLSVYKARPAFRMDMPAMVLLDGRTTGASEVLAAALAGSTRGVMLLGDVTRGDPLVREFIDLPGNLKLYLATRRLVVADGTVYDGRQGVDPHITATPDVVPDYEPELSEKMERELAEEEREDRRLRDRVRGDPVLRRAVDLLQGLRALNIGVLQTPETAAR